MLLLRSRINSARTVRRVTRARDVPPEAEDESSAGTMTGSSARGRRSRCCERRDGRARSRTTVPRRDECTKRRAGGHRAMMKRSCVEHLRALLIATAKGPTGRVRQAGRLVSTQEPAAAGRALRSVRPRRAPMNCGEFTDGARHAHPVAAREPDRQDALGPALATVAEPSSTKHGAHRAFVPRARRSIEFTRLRTCGATAQSPTPGAGRLRRAPRCSHAVIARRAATAEAEQVVGGAAVVARQLRSVIQHRGASGSNRCGAPRVRNGDCPGLRGKRHRRRRSGLRRATPPSSSRTARSRLERPRQGGWDKNGRWLRQGR